jgi:hypothetical protein
MTDFDLDLSDLIKGGQKELKKTKAEKDAEKRAKAREKQQAKYRALALPNEHAIIDPDFVSDSCVVQVVEQLCLECNSLTRYVGAVTLRQKHKRLPAFREISAPLDSNLPLRIRTHQMQTPHCVSCLTIMAKIDESFLTTEANASQLSLF